MVILISIEVVEISWRPIIGIIRITRIEIIRKITRILKILIIIRVIIRIIGRLIWIIRLIIIKINCLSVSVLKAF